MTIEIIVRKYGLQGAGVADTVIHNDGEPLSNVNAAAQLSVIAASNLALTPLNPAAAGVAISAGFAAMTILVNTLIKFYV